MALSLSDLRRFSNALAGFLVNPLFAIAICLLCAFLYLGWYRALANRIPNLRLPVSPAFPPVRPHNVDEWFLVLGGLIGAPTLAVDRWRRLRRLKASRDDAAARLEALTRLYETWQRLERERVSAKHTKTSKGSKASPGLKNPTAELEKLMAALTTDLRDYNAKIKRLLE